MQDHSPTTGVSGTTDPPTGEVTVRYWAGARAAAGVETEQVPATRTVGDLADALAAARPALAPVLAVCTLLLDGRAATPGATVAPGSVVEVLPPFAGG